MIIIFHSYQSLDKLSHYFWTNVSEFKLSPELYHLIQIVNHPLSYGKYFLFYIPSSIVPKNRFSKSVMVAAQYSVEV